MKTKFWELMSKWMPKTPFWFKMFLAKLLVKCLKDLENDIVLFNELRLWIKTSARPQTSNMNWWINGK